MYEKLKDDQRVEFVNQPSNNIKEMKSFYYLVIKHLSVTFCIKRKSFTLNLQINSNTCCS